MPWAVLLVRTVASIVGGCGVVLFQVLVKKKKQRKRILLTTLMTMGSNSNNNENMNNNNRGNNIPNSEQVPLVVETQQQFYEDDDGDNDAWLQRKASCFSPCHGGGATLGEAFDLIFVQRGDSVAAGPATVSFPAASLKSVVRSCSGSSTGGNGNSNTKKSSTSRRMMMNCSSDGVLHNEWDVMLEIAHAPQESNVQGWETPKRSRWMIYNQTIQAADFDPNNIENDSVPLQHGGGDPLSSQSSSSSDEQHDPQALREISAWLKPGTNKARMVLVQRSRSKQQQQSNSMTDDDDNDADDTEPMEDRVLGEAPIRIFLWSHTDRVVVVDIDGTITKSNIRGVVDTILTEQYMHCHDGVCQFLSGLEPTVRVLYLTSRPLGIASTTRKFLTQLRQADEPLPNGPLLGFPGSMAQVLMMELVSKSVHEFKRRTLQRNVVDLYRSLQVSQPLVAAFGNSLMDMQAYHGAGVPLKNIYLVDKKSNIYCLDCQAEREPQRKRDYVRARGTLFRGYNDGRLSAHVQELLANAQRNASTVVPLQVI